MGDRAWVGITFYEVGEEDQAKVHAFLVNQDMIDADDEVVLGEQYQCEEMNLGWCSDKVTDLVREAPSIVVDASQDNRYEFNGEQLYYAPDLGMFLAEADGGRNIVLTEEIVDRVYEGLPPGATAVDFKAALDKRFGHPVVDRILEFAEQGVRGSFSVEVPQPQPDLPGPWPQTDDEKVAFVEWQYEVDNGNTVASFREWYDTRPPEEDDEEDDQ